MAGRREVRAEDIRDRETLEAWLEGRPRQDAIVIAHRAALRVFPVFAARLDEDWARKGNLTAMPVLRCHLLAAVSILTRNKDIQFMSAHNSASFFGNLRDVKDAAAAASSATCGIDSFSYVGPRNLPAYFAIKYADDAMAAFSSEEVSLGAVRSDASALEQLNALTTSHIWMTRPPAQITQAEVKMLAIWGAEPPARWDFWRRWWEGAKRGQYLDPQLQLAIVQGVDDETWEAGPDAVAARIREIEAGFVPPEPDGLDAPAERPTRQIRAVRAQVSALKEYLDTEFQFLRGHNHLNPANSAETDDLIDLLRELQALVDKMLQILEDEPDPGTALMAVENNLPAIVEKAGELALVEPEPQVSATVASMAVTIKALTDAGAPGDLATKFAIGEVASRKLEKSLWARIRHLFPRKDKDVEDV